MKKSKLTRQQKEDRHVQMIVNEILRYFEDEHYGTSDTWRETKLRYRIYKVFDKIFWKREGEFDMNSAVKELRTVLPEMKKLLKTIWTPEGDGTPYDTESDYGNLSYISDRWFCQFRLTWLINLAERNEEYIKRDDDWHKVYIMDGFDNE